MNRRLLALTASAVLIPASASLAFWDGPVTELSPPSGPAERPALAAGGDGSTTVVWQRRSAPDTDRIEARRFAGGEWGPVAPVDTPPAGTIVEEPAVAAGPGGTAIAAWGVRDGENDPAIRASRYAAGEWDVPVPLGNGEQPQVIVDAAGVATVVWASTGLGQPVIQARRRVGGTWLPAENLSDGARPASQPRVAVDPSGVVTAAWVRDNAADGKLDVQVSRFSGTAWSTPQNLSDPDAGADNPQLVVDPSGTVTAVWAKTEPAPGPGPDLSVVQAARFSGGSWGPREDVSPVGASAFGHRVAVDAAGSVTAIWFRLTGPGEGIVQAARRSGGGWSAPHDLSGPASPVFLPEVTARGAGTAIALWTQGTGPARAVRAALFSSGAWGEAVPVSIGEATAEGLRATTDPAGTATVAWSSGDGDTRLVKASRVALPAEPTSPPAPTAPAPVAPSPTAPGAPVQARAQAGLRSALVRWTPPASDGGAAVSGYVVRALPGGRTCRWNGGPTACRVTGLANTRAFRFTVTAENSTGPGPASTPSAPVRPWAPLRVGRPRVGPLAIDVLVRAPGAGRAQARGTARIGRRASAVACSGAARTRARGRAISLPVRCALTAAARRQRARGPVRVNLTVTHTTTKGALFRADRAVVVRRG